MYDSRASWKRHCHQLQELMENLKKLEERMNRLERQFAGHFYEEIAVGRPAQENDETENNYLILPWINDIL